MSPGPIFLQIEHSPRAGSLLNVLSTEQNKMELTLHRATTRGHAHHGWLNSHHTFSFGSYHNPKRMNFGVLRVLNDDVVAGGMGFNTHPHENMEIVSIPLEGDLQHKDSMGNTTVIRQGDIQVMSAGTGVQHSEFNKNADQEVKFLQIWLFPNKMDVTPRYDQMTLNGVDSRNTLQQILSPNPEDDGVWVYQNAWFHLGNFDTGHEATYHIKSAQNGVYAFVIEGSFEIAGQILAKRDGLGIKAADSFNIKSIENGTILLMDVPMVPE